MGIAAVTADGKRVWRCDTCGKQERWSDSWTWFGSLMMADEHPEQILSYCSEACAAEPKKKTAAGWRPAAFRVVP